ncbi:MAG: hypothetical protein AAGI63_16355 [Planctomycetota bacterium]
MLRFHLAFLLAFALLHSAFGQDAPVGLLTADDLMNMHQTLSKCPEEPWRSIPWKTSVLEAQREAATTGKPILIWAMDGHPLGCT